MEDPQQFLESDTPDKAKIIVDHREDIRFIDWLKAYGALVLQSQLVTGDFICSARCIVERKTRDDFEASVIDGRLFSQLPVLVENYERVIIIVEGESNADRLRKESLLGAYVTIITDFGAALFFTKDKEKTAELIYAIAKHEQLVKKHPMRLYARKRTFTLAQMQRAIIESFPSIGPKKAKQLLLHFGTILNLVNATEQDLKAVPGLGPKRVKIIRNILEQSYTSDEDTIA